MNTPLCSDQNWRAQRQMSGKGSEGVGGTAGPSTPGGASTPAASDVPEKLKMALGLSAALSADARLKDGRSSQNDGTVVPLRDVPGLTLEQSTPSVQLLLDLFEVVGDQCAAAAGPSEANQVVSSPFAAFSQAHGSAIVQLKASRKALVAQCDVVRHLARGNTSEITLLSRAGRPCVRKRMHKSTVTQQANTVSYTTERDILAQAEMARAMLESKTPLVNEVELPDSLTMHKLDRVARLLFAYQDVDTLNLVTDYYPGGDLCILCDKFEYGFSEGMALFYVAEIALALDTIHTLGFVHRDLRPDNVFIDARGHAVVGDFGLAARLDSRGNVAASDRAKPFYSQAPEYLAPELMKVMHSSLTDGTYGKAADWWSLGVLMYELLHGVSPFEGPADTVSTTREIYLRVTSHTTLELDTTKFAEPTVDLLNRLVCPDQGARLDGANVFSHPFFSDVNWDNLHETTAPFVPELSSLFDVQFFDDVGSPDPMGNPPPTPMRRSGSSISLGCGIGGLASSLPFLGYGFVSPRMTPERSGDTPKAHRFLRRMSSMDLRHKPSSLSQQGGGTGTALASLLTRADTPDTTGAVGRRPISSPTLAPPTTSTSPQAPPRRRVSFNNDVIFLDAAKSGQLETVKEMVNDHDVPLEKRTATGMTAVCLAATNGHMDVLRYLIDQGADVNVRCPDGCTPLHLAILEEQVEVVKYLLEHGADRTAETPEGETPMDWAEDCEPILEILGRSDV
eukprot:m.191560 g.191560  ORF g.191560 m.191560 type:complete len:736 (-) comp18387_c0_seq1:22-2229(-)